MIISVHVPKTAGMSFRQVLDNEYENRILLDYDYSVSHLTIEEKRKDVISRSKKFNYFKRKYYSLNGIKCIHGHFWPIKYVKFKKERNIKFVTWLRDPIERIISHYYFWKRNPQGDSTNRIKRQMIFEGWSLERFCLSIELKNFYTNWYWNFPLENFDFIGITEYFEEDLKYFSSNFLSKEIVGNTPKINLNPDKEGLYSKNLTAEQIIRIKNFHRKDYEIYEHALNTRKKRI